MKRILTGILLLVATAAQAVPYANPKLYADGTLGPAPDPLQTVMLDNYSHTVSLANSLWFELIYQGSATCYVRIMNTPTKASWAAEPVAAGASKAYIVNGNAKWLNYSGCYGTSTANSVLHLM